MALDPEVLLNYPIPEVRQRYSRRDSAFYALSLGLGGDPLDERQLAYVDPCRDLQALPCMALVLGHPGFWLGNPATGVDALRLVHGEQRLEWRRPLPAEGEVIGRTRVTGLVDKGADKGALLYSEKVLSDALSGEVLAVARSTTFLRGDGGFGGSRQVPETPHRLPERTPDLRLDLPDPSGAGPVLPLNGDDNPLHAEPAAALRAGFPRPILHGLCTLGVAFHAVLRGLADYRAGATGTSAGAFLGSGVSRRDLAYRDVERRLVPHSRPSERDVVVLDNGRVGPAARAAGLKRRAAARGNDRRAAVKINRNPACENKNNEMQPRFPRTRRRHFPAHHADRLRLLLPRPARRRRRPDVPGLQPQQPEGRIRPEQLRSRLPPAA
ncbi:3-alpha,7-alpha, 12-alpha-trihydroxy-5-beta-cholest-24-enoyl-CoA hydratase [Pseudomonas aeruginosa]|nr:3-alpha,7-alpha, 12-alpha-trihydroxy-5-beta-cholest-24-enoyl-CoA hydratase [Pseudomonas aeruginosa]